MDEFAQCGISLFVRVNATHGQMDSNGKLRTSVYPFPISTQLLQRALRNIYNFRFFDAKQNRMKKRSLHFANSEAAWRRRTPNVRSSFKLISNQRDTSTACVSEDLQPANFRHQEIHFEMFFGFGNQFFVVRQIWRSVKFSKRC